MLIYMNWKYLKLALNIKPKPNWFSLLFRIGRQGKNKEMLLTFNVQGFSDTSLVIMDERFSNWNKLHWISLQSRCKNIREQYSQKRSRQLANNGLAIGLESKTSDTKYSQVKIVINHGMAYYSIINGHTTSPSQSDEIKGDEGEAMRRHDGQNEK